MRTAISGFALRPGQRGTTLLMVLVLLAAMSAAAVEALRLGQVESVASAMRRNRSQAESLLLSGLRAACAELALDAKDEAGDHLGERWAEDDGITGRLEFQTGTLECRISDESALFPVGALADNQEALVAFTRLLSGPAMQVEPETAKAIAEAVKDYMDPDEDGSYEDAAYASLGLLYKPANRALRSLQELRRVPGMTDEIWNGGRDTLALKDLLSAQSEKVNMNTAKRQVLEACFPDTVDEETGRAMVRAMLDFRANAANYPALRKSGWHRNMGSFKTVPMLEGLLGVESNVFALDAEAVCGATRRRMRVLLYRGQGKDPRTGENRPMVFPGGLEYR